MISIYSFFLIYTCAFATTIKTSLQVVHRCPLMRLQKPHLDTAPSFSSEVKEIIGYEACNLIGDVQCQAFVSEYPFDGVEFRRRRLEDYEHMYVFISLKLLYPLDELAWLTFQSRLMSATWLGQVTDSIHNVNQGDCISVTQASYPQQSGQCWNFDEAASGQQYTQNEFCSIRLTHPNAMCSLDIDEDGMQRAKRVSIASFSELDCANRVAEDAECGSSFSWNRQHGVCKCSMPGFICNGAHVSEFSNVYMFRSGNFGYFGYEDEMSEEQKKQKEEEQAQASEAAEAPGMLHASNSEAKSEPGQSEGAETEESEGAEVEGAETEEEEGEGGIVGRTLNPIPAYPWTIPNPWVSANPYASVNPYAGVNPWTYATAWTTTAPASNPYANAAYGSANQASNPYASANSAYTSANPASNPYASANVAYTSANPALNPYTSASPVSNAYASGTPPSNPDASAHPWPYYQMPWTTTTAPGILNKQHSQKVMNNMSGTKLFVFTGLISFWFSFIFVTFYITFCTRKSKHEEPLMTPNIESTMV